MKHTARVLVTLAAMMAAPNISTAKDYLCIADQSIGFEKPKSETSWRLAKRTEQQAFIITELKPDQPYRWQRQGDATMLGKLSHLIGIRGIDRVAPCFSSIDKSMTCRTIYGYFEFRIKTKRFVYAPAALFIDEPFKGLREEISLQIGTCTELKRDN